MRREQEQAEYCGHISLQRAELDHDLLLLGSGSSLPFSTVILSEAAVSVRALLPPLSD